MSVSEEEFNQKTLKLLESGYIGSVPSYRDWILWCERNKEIWK